MARLAVLVLTTLVLVGCTTPGRAPEVEPVEQVAVETAPPEAPAPVVVPQVFPTGSPPSRLENSPGTLPWIAPSWDPATLSFGWVELSSWARRLDTSGRFWTENRELWVGILSSPSLTSQDLYPLAQVYRSTLDTDEKFWAAYGIYRLYRDGGLEQESQIWRDRAQQIRRTGFLDLDLCWDLAFLRQNLEEARRIWPRIAMVKWSDSRDASRIRLLRQRLFSGELSLVPLGLDAYVSSLALDRDDLWVGTWNGALARVSLSTGEWSVLSRPAIQIAPIKLLRVNRFFVYVFREFGFSRYSKVTGGWREFGYPPGWSGLRIQDALITGDESLWIAHLGQGLWSWESGNWQSHAADSPSLFLNAVAKGPDGSLLIGTQDQGLWRWWRDTWSRLGPSAGRGPSNISVIAKSSQPDELRWAIGTYGQGLWLTDGVSLSALSNGGEYVTAIDWSGPTPWWSILDQGLWHGDKGPWEVLGLRDGLIDPSATAMVVHGGRLFWGTTGHSVQFWSEDDDPLVYR